MTLTTTISAFIALGRYIKANINACIIQDSIDLACIRNPWFTPENCKNALINVAEEYLDDFKLNHFLASYDMANHEPKTIGLISAGNIPLVSWHDVMCILLSGNNLQIKLSDKEQVLTKMLLHELTAIVPQLKENISIVDRLENYDAVIATGSTNTNRYFEYYFRTVPHLLRSGRNSVAVLTGNESKDQLVELGRDIFDYFGLGCRNVSLLLVPTDWQPNVLLDNLAAYSQVGMHHKYANNYLYNQSIYLLNKVKHYDNGFLLLTASELIASPMSVLHFYEYENDEQVQNFLTAQIEKIQCVVTESGPVTFGKSQQPNLFDYADGVDTMKFLLELNS
ncbi:MAG: acyl-CoA reductase [Bacteroidota bacterium]|nr:acyl-CoA reductase [Bacteroidota bacterium]